MIEFDSTGPGNPLAAPQPSVPLQQRVSRAASVQQPDPQLEAFYPVLLDWENSGAPSALSFIGQYRSADDQRPYASSGQQMTVLQTVLQRLKDDGLEDSVIYRQLYQAFTTVFGVKDFINRFSQEVFDPQAIAEQEEESSW